MSPFFKDSTLPPENNVTPVFVSKKPDVRPYVSIDSCGEKVAALVDTGASVSVFGGKGLYLIEKFI